MPNPAPGGYSSSAAPQPELRPSPRSRDLRSEPGFCCCSALLSSCVVLPIAMVAPTCTARQLNGVSAKIPLPFRQGYHGRRAETPYLLLKGGGRQLLLRLEANVVGWGSGGRCCHLLVIAAASCETPRPTPTPPATPRPLASPPRRRVS